MAAVGDGPSRCRRLVDRGEAIRAALGEAAAGDLVAIAGKGHEGTLEIGDRLLPFDDREVAIESLRRLGFEGGRHA